MTKTQNQLIVPFRNGICVQPLESRQVNHLPLVDKGQEVLPGVATFVP